MSKKLSDAARAEAGRDASDASLLRDRARELDKQGDHKLAQGYHQGAQKAENRADLWRDLAD